MTHLKCNVLQHHIVFQQILIMCHILVYLGSCVQMLREHLLYSFFYQCSLCLWWKSKLMAIFWQRCVVRPKHVHSDHCKCPINVYSVFKLIKLATHTQAHSKPCREMRTEMLRCMSTSAGRSYAHGTYATCRLNCLHLIRFRTFWMIQEISGTKPH